MADKVSTIVEQLSQQNPFSGADGLADPPRPSDAAIPRDRPSVEQIPHIQQQINVLTYNHLPRTFFSLEKHRSLQSILMTAKEALTEALPIRCLEATFVALHYTQCLRDVDRIPLSFKSEANGGTYRHIVLVLRTRSTPSLYGALGLSRKSTLMYKPMTFTSLYDLVMDYKRSYEELGHELADIKLGIAITHDEHSRFDPCWRFIALKLSRYNEATATASPTETRDAAPASLTHRKASSPASPRPRKLGGQSSETSLRSPTGRNIAPPLLNWDAAQGDVRTPASRGEGHLDRSGDAAVWADAPSASPAHHPRRTSLNASSSVLSPVTSHSGSTVATRRPEVTPTAAGATDAYAPLARLLGNYSRLLPTICDQYYKTIGTIDASNRPLKLCYMDLDTAEKDAGIENQRRLQYIAEMQSPLSPEARRAAANRQLRPAKKERANSRQPATAAGAAASPNGSGAKRRQVSSNEGRPAKRPSPASPTLLATDAKRSAAGAAPTHTNRSPPRPLRTPTTPSAVAPSAPAPIAARADAFPAHDGSTSLSLSAALAEHSRSSRYPLSLEGTMVDAQSIGSCTSAEQTGTEGYATPHHGYAAAGEVSDASPAAPPLTPRNYDARKPTTPYDAFLRTPSSTSDLFSSPTSLNNTMVANLVLSP